MQDAVARFLSGAASVSMNTAIEALRTEWCRGGRTRTGFHPKVLEFSARQAPTDTIAHIVNLFSNLAASTARSVWPMVPSRSSWFWHSF